LNKGTEERQTLRRFKPYPAYKDSGVEWLGQIPAHWEVKRLRFLGFVNPSPGELRSASPSLEVTFIPMDALGEWGGFNLEATKQLSEVSSGYTYFRDGDVLVAKITPCFENGKGAVARGLTNGIGFGTTELHVIRPGSGLHADFLAYLTFSRPFRGLGQVEMKGAAGQQRVSEEFIKDFPVPLPPLLLEQRAIAAFLDRETAKIDALVAKKERLIELLQENRTALITRAVTKGLDLNAPMKDSGVEWLGEIPVHWEVMALKQLTSLRAGEAITSDHIDQAGEYPVYGGNGVRGYTSSFTHEGDFPLIGRQGALCGCINFASGRFWASEHAVVAAPLRGVDARWLAYLLTAMSLNEYSESAAQPGLAVSVVASIHAPRPPLPEQRAIAAFLDRETAKIDALIAKIHEGIERLKEYRTALISAAVTGKIDVQEFGSLE
jgi:type I restriction enzyme S subunit